VFLVVLAVGVAPAAAMAGKSLRPFDGPASSDGRAVDGGDGKGASARREIPLRTAHPAELERLKAVKASVVPGGGASLRCPSFGPRAALFGGLNKAGMASAGTTTPPDSTGAIGPSHYLEFVNGTGITAYDRNLNPVSGPVALEDFIGFPSDAVFDPQIQWDQQWGRWIYAMDDVEGPEDNYIAFGWSKSADPSNLSTAVSGGWCGYFIYTAELFDDYPKLGHSDSGITIGTNVFGPGFLGSRLWSIAKPPSPQTCPSFPSLSIGATGALITEDSDVAFTPVPANPAGSTPNSYVVAADLPEGGPATEVMAWHLSGAGASATLVADGNIGVAGFEVPANVPQPGTAEVLDSLDTRLTNAVAAVDPAVGQEAVWTQHTVDGPGGRSVVRWYEFLPGSQTLRQAGEASDPSHFVFNGAISPSAQGDAAALNFNRGSATLFPEMHAVSRDPAVPLGQMGNDVLLGTSAGAAVDFSCDIGLGEACRWGDYAGASPDPAQPGVVWGSNQGLAAPSGVASRWTTRNFALLADDHAPAAPTITGTEPAGPADDNAPRVKGVAEGGTTVDVFESADCSGPAAGRDSAAVFGSTGIAVPVADNQTVALSATATDPAGNVSPCSAPSGYTESTPPKPQPGIAIAAATAKVKRGKALLRLRCRGGGDCRGSLRLVVQVKVRKGKRLVRRNLVIGRAGFRIAAGGSKLVRVKLTARGVKLVNRAGKRGLKVKLRGKGVRNRVVQLRR
jgi:hypothetical protein